MAEAVVLQDGAGNAVGTTASPLVINSNQRVVSKLLTFTGGTPDTLGDHDSTVTDPYTIFTVTGKVLARVFGICGVALVGTGATMEVGVTSDTAAIIPQLADAEDIDAGEIWQDATPTHLSEVVPSQLIVQGNVILTLGTANITSGTLTMYCIWEPLTSGATVV